MKLISLIKYNFRRQFRDRLGLGLTLLTAPFLVVLYGLFLNQGPFAPKQVVVFYPAENNRYYSDFREGGWPLIDLLQKAAAKKPEPAFEIKTATTQADFKKRLVLGDAVMGIVISREDPDLPLSRGNPLLFSLHGNITDPVFQSVSAAVQLMLYNAMLKSSGISLPLKIVEEPLGASSMKTAFDMYVPSLLVFAVIMLVFSSAMSITREVESGTLERLKMTRLSTVELMAGLSAVQLTLGILSVILTFLTAVIVGFNVAGELSTALLLTILSCFSSVGIGMIVASLSRTLVLSFLIASVCMFLMVLFSGMLFPRPEMALFQLYGHTIDLFDFLPTSHLGVGLNKVLTLGATITDITYEIVFLLFSAVCYFGIGVVIFRKTSFSFFSV